MVVAGRACAAAAGGGARLCAHGQPFPPAGHAAGRQIAASDDASRGALCPKVDDYPIFFATMQSPSKDNSGEKIFVRKSDYPKAKTVKNDASDDHVAEAVDSYETGAENLDEYLLDTHGHLIVKHDLFNHEGLTQDGIAEAFIEFAKRENLSFVGKN